MTLPGLDRLLPWWRLLDALPHLGRDARDDGAAGPGAWPRTGSGSPRLHEPPDEVAFTIEEHSGGPPQSRT